MKNLLKIDIDRIAQKKDCDQLLLLLLHPKKEMRISAARALANLKAEEDPQHPTPIQTRRAARPLALLLHDPSGKVRLGSCRALGEIGDPRAIQLLAERVTQDPSAAVRKEAAYSLGKIGHPTAVDALIEAAADQNRHVQKTAVKALGMIADPSAAEPLMRGLEQNFFHSDARLAAFKSLSQIGDQRAVPHLIRALSEWDDRTQQAAAAALCDLPDPEAAQPLVSLLYRNGLTSRIAGRALLRIGTPAVPYLLDALRDDDWEFRRRAGILLKKLNRLTKDTDPLLYDYLNQNWEELAQLGAPAVEPLKYALEHSINYGIQCSIIQALGKTHAVEAVPPLVELLSRTERAFSGQAAIALQEIGKPAVGTLISILKAPDLDSWYRKIIVDVLCNIGDSSATPVLTHILYSRHHAERLMAVNALAQCGDAGAINDLHRALHNEHAALEDEFRTRFVSPEAVMHKEIEFKESIQKALEAILARRD